jgi:hypothetical protein
MTRLILMLCLLGLTPALRAEAAQPDEFFENKIRPVLVESCLKCHGGEKTSSGLRLDGRRHLVAGGDRGPAIIPGDADSSLLVESIRGTHDDLVMPPNKPLPEAVVHNFSQWIDAGAVWPERVAGAASDAGRHWAFVPPGRVPVPERENEALSSHPIDRFIEARQREFGLRPVAAADRATLIRRASFDLTGLPPTWQQAERFVSDSEPRAFERLIDQLLASPRYGERWGRYWLDLARYADTAGENSDYPIPQAHLYRDYVINAFNADKPYDQFIREQIAGDLMATSGPPEDYAEQVIATGFIAQAKRFGTGDLEDMHLIIEDTLDTMGKVVLGLGLRCARCHDHKYDPTTSEDYYALYGFFESTAYPFPGGESVKEQRYFVPTVPPSQLAAADEAYFRQHGDEISRLERLIEAKEDLKANETMLAEIKKNAPSKLAPLAYAVKEGKPTDARVQSSGNPWRKGDVVRRRFPEFLCGGERVEMPDDASGRLELAQWLTRPDNPLTARVMVNRIWQFHFGRPIVATPSNFGLQGAPPTHPDLLDWLALQFIDSGWSIKAMHRLIMSSQTYQRGSVQDTGNAVIDSGNQYYWRFDRRRLDAEAIRDSMLLLGGNLNLEPPGPHPFPPADQWRWTAHRQFKAVYPTYHRSVYLMVQRLHPHPFLALFNGPDTSASTAMRDQSTVPLQALFMTNSELVDEQSQGLGRSLLELDVDDRERIEWAYRRVFLRTPAVREVDRGVQFIDRYRTILSDEGVADAQRLQLAWSALARTLLTSNEFLFVD